MSGSGDSVKKQIECNATHEETKEKKRDSDMPKERV
jgi:hypothetical protein